MSVAGIKDSGEEFSAKTELLSAVRSLPRADWLLAIAAFIVLPNIVYLLPLHSQLFPRAIFDVDFMLLGAAAFYLPWPATVVLYVALWLLDILVVISRMYFFSFDEFLVSFGFLSTGIDIQWAQRPVDYLLLSIGATILGAAGAAKLSGTRRKKFSLALVAIAVLMSFFDILNGSSSLPMAQALTQSGIQLTPVNLATSAVTKAAQDTLAGRGEKSTRWRPVRSAAGIALGLSFPRDAGVPLGATNVAMIVVESWGHAAGPVFDRWVAGAVFAPAIRAHYDILTGTVPFSGGTVHAELRELCGYDGYYRTISAGQTKRCLPAIFAARGFHTTGIHGYSMKMYSRDRWWPKVGIREAIFGEEMSGLPQCGNAFPGVCDSDALRVLGERLTRPGPQFGYLVTLNSHLPLGVPSLADRARDCDKGPVALDDAECGLVVAWRKVLAGAADMALQLRDKPTTIVIVGDHRPPLWAGLGAGLFSRSAVPYIILKPKPAGR